jgi:hypothetical protein
MTTFKFKVTPHAKGGNPAPYFMETVVAESEEKAYDQVEELARDRSRLGDFENSVFQIDKQ